MRTVTPTCLGGSAQAIRPSALEANLHAPLARPTRRFVIAPSLVADPERRPLGGDEVDRVCAALDHVGHDHQRIEGHVRDRSDDHDPVAARLEAQPEAGALQPLGMPLLARRLRRGLARRLLQLEPVDVHLELEVLGPGRLEIGVDQQVRDAGTRFDVRIVRRLRSGAGVQRSGQQRDTRTPHWARPDPSRVSTSSASRTMRSISSAALGRSSITPITWPPDITPAEASPSTMLLRWSIGAFAAITTWLHDSSRVRFIESASRITSRQGAPDMRLKRTALASARDRLANSPARSSFSVNSVASTRCGWPSTCVVRSVSVALFDR